MKIDKIFIINLEYRTDRKEQMINELEKHNITNYEFFNAVRPGIQDIIEWNNNYCSHVKNSFPRSDKFLNYQIGCLGCLKSHVEVCKLALERNYKNILILEDDTEFIHNLDTLSKFSSQINDNYDMLYLCGSHNGPREKITENIVKTKKTHTTGSYLITENAMKYLLENIKSYSKEIDVFYAEEIQSRFNCYCTLPHISKQKDGYSDIQQGNVSYNLTQ
jgi:GR25 family glycosyltransferase involved in LPS biosynthesis